MTDDTTKTQRCCSGSGGPALLDPASGFYGCPICKVPQGVILRAGGYLVPDHPFGEVHRERGDSTFVLRVPEHQQMPVLLLAAQQGLPKDMVIDLLAQGLMRMQAVIQQERATMKQSTPLIVLTGHGGEG